MQPSKQSRGGKDLFRERLDAIIELKHPLVRLAGVVPWSDFDAAFGRFYKPLGRPAKATRLMVGLQYLKHTFDLSDEVTPERWVENSSMSFFKKKVAKHRCRSGRAACGVFRGCRCGRGQNADGDGRSVFHPRIGYRMSACRRGSTSNLERASA